MNPHGKPHYREVGKIRVKTVTYKFSSKAKALYIPVTIEYVNDEGFIERKRVKSLIDTGATQSGIDSKFAESLNFTTIGITKQNTANGIMFSGIHTINIEITEGFRFSDIEILENNTGIELVIGMDILSQCDFILSHKDDYIILSLRNPTANNGERFVSTETKVTAGELFR